MTLAEFLSSPLPDAATLQTLDAELLRRTLP